MNSATDLWFRRSIPRPNALRRLLIVPHAGGGPSFYRDWAERVLDDVEVVVVQLPGREARWKEAPLAQQPQLIDQLVQHVRPLLDRPFVVFGHSLGARIAHALVSRLCTAGFVPELLVASGARPPHRASCKMRLSELTDTALKDELLRLGGTPASVVNNEELFQLFLPTLRADLQLFDSAGGLVSPIPVPIIACRGESDSWASMDDLLSWRELTTQRFYSVLYPGGHFYLSNNSDRLVKDVMNERERPAKVAIDEVWLWLIDLAAPSLSADSLRLCLTPTEQKRAARFLRPGHAERFIVARAALRQILAAQLGVSPAGVHLQTGPHGKPFVEGTVQFNLTHSGNLALVAVSDNCQVGVDIEQIRPTFAGVEIAKRYFSPAEVDELLGRPPAQHVERFFTYWSCKEAYIKGRGLGLDLPLDQFDIVLSHDNEPGTVCDRHCPSESNQWQMRPLFVESGYAAALATRSSRSQIVLKKWPNDLPT